MKYDSYARKGEQVSVGNFLRKDHRNSTLHNQDLLFFVVFFFFRQADVADNHLPKQDVFENFFFFSLTVYA